MIGHHLLRHGRRYLTAGVKVANLRKVYDNVFHRIECGSISNFGTSRILRGSRKGSGIAHKGCLGWDGAHHMARFNGVGAQ